MFFYDYYENIIKILYKLKYWNLNRTTFFDSSIIIFNFFDNNLKSNHNFPMKCLNHMSNFSPKTFIQHVAVIEWRSQCVYVITNLVTDSTVNQARGYLVNIIRLTVFHHFRTEFGRIWLEGKDFKSSKKEMINLFAYGLKIKWCMLTK